MNTRQKQRYELHKQLNLSSITWSIAGLFDSFLTSAIYTTYIKPGFQAVYEQTLKFVFLPVMLCNSVVAAICAWHLAHLERNEDGTMKRGKVVRAAVATVAALLMTGAVVFGLIGIASTHILSPIFFAMNMALTSMFNIGAGIYYWGKSAGTPDAPSRDIHETDPEVVAAPSKKKLYRERAIGHAIAGVIGASVAAVAMIVVVLGKTIYAPIGTTLGIIGAILTGVELFKTIRNHIKLVRAHNDKPSRKMEQTDEQEPLLTPDARADSAYIYASLNQQPSPQPANDDAFCKDPVNSIKLPDMPQNEPASTQEHRLRMT